MIRVALTIPACVGLLLSASQLSAKETSVESVYDNAIDCRVAAYGALQALSREEPQNAEETQALESVEETEFFYRKLSLLLGRQMDRDDSLIGLDFTKKLLEWSQAILKSQATSADMLASTLTCGEAISEAEKAQ